MWRMLKVLASMVGIAPLEDDESANRAAGEQRISETTIMARKILLRGIFSSMGETSVLRKLKKRKLKKRKLKKPVTVHAAGLSNNFNLAYFRKFYLNAATRVVTAAEMRSRAALIAGVLKQCQIPVRSILDAGCGIGLMRKPFKELLPRARYVGLEASQYLCTRFGWIQGSITDFAQRVPFDLVVCYDVLQYLPDLQAARAIVNMAKLTRAALYVSALTTEDWRENCDRSRTDRAVHLRSGAWYRRRLNKSFRYVGFGIWVRKNVTAILWEMERARR
jgi:2-polyprenyl-3-methyl-5-hydroxy-6-metoxy-1,4-benzoquinol methylase